MTDDSPSISIAPMIDCVFLMLVYFMVSSSLERSEAGLSLALPGSASSNSALDFQDEQMIEISSDGSVTVNGYQYDSSGDPALPELSAMLVRFRENCERSSSSPRVQIAPSGETRQARIIEVMDALTQAGIEKVRFAISEDF